MKSRTGQGPADYISERKENTMKRFIAFMLLLALLVSMLVSCKPTKDGEGGKTEIPEGMDGKTASQLILANERLNSQLLKNEDNIFEKGSEDLKNLAKIVQESIPKYASAMSNLSVRELEAVTNKDAMTDGSWVSVNGTNFKWGGFAEYSNSYDTFVSYAKSISDSALRGAELIDDVKKNVRVVDMWVDRGSHLYLHVDENSETLYSRAQDVFQIEICRRYKDENGNNVYEVYYYGVEEDYETYNRMLYIPGLRYEFSIKMISDTTPMDNCIIADNSKGYWEILNTNSDFDENGTVSCMVIKDDICYDAFYNPQRNEIGPFKIISADKKTDIMIISDIENETLTVELALQGLNGYEYVEITTTEDKIANGFPYEGEKEIIRGENGIYGTYYQTTGFAPPTQIKLNNGNLLKTGDTLLNGKVSVHQIHVRYQSKDANEGYVGDIMLLLKGDSFEDRMQTLYEFFEQTGLDFRRDKNVIEAGILRAHEEMDALSKYYEWDGAKINDIDAMVKAHEREIARTMSSKDMYEKIKDARVIELDNSEEMALNMYFGKVSASTQGANEENGTITIDKLTLTTTDTLLFVEGEPYVIKLALVGQNGELYHLEYEGATEKAYVKGDSFSLEQSGISIKTPLVELVGNYDLVAYISSADGIRSSGFDKVKADPMVMNSPSYRYGITQLTVHINESAITLEYQLNGDIEIDITLDAPISYDELYEIMAEEVYKYGIIDSTQNIKKFISSGDWREIAKGDTSVGEGTFLIGFTRQIGTELVGADIIVNLSIKK